MRKEPGFEARLEALLRATRRQAPGPCPPPGTWVELERGALEPGVAEHAREHLVECHACRQAARDARRFLTAMGAGGAAEAGERLGGRGRRHALLALAAAALFASAGLTLWYLGARRALPAAAWTAAAYVPGAVDPRAPLLRDAAALDPTREAAFARAMAAYEAADYPAAERALGAYRGAEPEDLRAAFYHAVALGLTGDRRQAAPLLERVAREASPRLADEARWYLALLALERGETTKARGLLEAVAVSASPRAPEAARLAERLAE
jgi:tetratricopeptide (TPR) repeat protein